MKCFTAPFRFSMLANRWRRVPHWQHRQVAAPNFAVE
jgi:hypothetical protein